MPGAECHCGRSDRCRSEFPVQAVTQAFPLDALGHFDLGGCFQNSSSSCHGVCLSWPCPGAAPGFLGTPRSRAQETQAATSVCPPCPGTSQAPLRAPFPPYTQSRSCSVRETLLLPARKERLCVVTETVPEALADSHSVTPTHNSHPECQKPDSDDFKLKMSAGSGIN